GSARLLEVAGHQRAGVGERRVRPVAGVEPVAGLPLTPADEVDGGAVEPVAVLAHGELAHPFQDEQLDLFELRQVDQRLDLPLPCAHLRRSSPAFAHSPTIVRYPFTLSLPITHGLGSPGFRLASAASFIFALSWLGWLAMIASA